MDTATLPKEILDRVDALARTLGTTTEFLFQRLCDESLRLGKIDAALCCACLVGFVFGIAAIWKGSRSPDVFKDGSKDYDVPQVVVTIGFGITLSVVSVACLFGNVSDAAKHLGAPTTYAINTLKGLFS